VIGDFLIVGTPKQNEKTNKQRMNLTPELTV
jgi:hypothetical protein